MYKIIVPIIFFYLVGACTSKSRTIDMDDKFMLLFEEQIINSNVILVTKVNGMCSDCLNTLEIWNEKYLKYSSDTTYIIIISTFPEVLA